MSDMFMLVGASIFCVGLCIGMGLGGYCTFLLFRAARNEP